MVCNGGFQLIDAQATCQGLGFGTDDARVMSVSATRYIAIHALPYIVLLLNMTHAAILVTSVCYPPH